MLASEAIENNEVKVGDIIYVALDADDGLTLNRGFLTRRKYIVIIGFTPEGVAIGALLINSNIDITKRSSALLDSQYPLLARHYKSVLDYDSWLDCSDIFELSINKIKSRGGCVKGRLIDEDLERVSLFLRETDLIDNATKRRYGLI